MLNGKEDMHDEVLTVADIIIVKRTLLSRRQLVAICLSPFKFASD